jgi:hypothetical protein
MKGKAHVCERCDLFYYGEKRTFEVGHYEPGNTKPVQRKFK